MGKTYRDKKRYNYKQKDPENRTVEETEAYLSDDVGFRSFKKISRKKRRAKEKAAMRHYQETLGDKNSDNHNFFGK